MQCMRGPALSERSRPSWRRSTLAGLGAVLVLIPLTNPEIVVPRVVAWYESSEPMKLRPVVLFGSGTLTTPNATSKAITYDPDLAPIGAAMTATVTPTSEGSTADVTVFGLVPNRGYAVSAHTKACGSTATAAGARFQYRPDPATSSAPTQTEQANRVSEISLTVRTDPTGAGTSRITVPFTLTDQVPESMVVHDTARRSVRVACLTLSVR
jgi:superoxide dismutase, Cu-Zn family